MGSCRSELRKCKYSVHCKEDPIYLYTEMKLRGLVPSFHIHVSVSDLYMYSRDRSTYFAAAK
jgi:hypothetical protein